MLHQDWLIESQKRQEKSKTGYVGIQNPGCICYMNSCIQQLFMISEFREAILRIKQRYINDPKEDLLHQFQLLFWYLQSSEKMYADPKGLCHAYKDFDGNPTNLKQ